MTSTVAVNGNGTYSSTSFTPATAGTYVWRASCSGDVNNAAVPAVCGGASESVTVGKATTFLHQAASGNSNLAGTVSDTATLTGGFARGTRPARRLDLRLSPS
jgi:hypothetical protein